MKVSLSNPNSICHAPLSYSNSIPLNPNRTGPTLTNPYAQPIFKNCPSNPNSIIFGRDIPYTAKQTTKLGGKDALIARKISTQSDNPPKQGRKRCASPARDAVRPEGIKAFPAKELEWSDKLVEPRGGERLESKKLIRNANGILMRKLVSQQYEPSDFYGRTRAFGGERHSTFSHKEILFNTAESVTKEIQSNEGPKYLEKVDEWERKIMNSQGKACDLVSRKDAFKINKLYGKNGGTGDYYWRTKEKSERDKNYDIKINQLRNKVESQQDTKIAQLRASLSSYKTSQK